ncbi:MAG: hypothetical protein WAW37_01870 [Syntrophobacteraceae bacterium]
MAHNLRLFELFEGRKSPKIVLAVSVILLLVLELAIYIAVSSQSGLKSRVVVADTNGTKVYESAGTALTSYEKMTFENNFGPLRNYSTHVETELVPFPMRTWVLLAIGIPMGLILLLSFLVQVWLLLLNGSPREAPGNMAAADGKTRIDSFLSASRNFSVLHVGFVIVLAMLILWLVPSFLGDVAKSCFGAVREYQWFFVGLAVFAGGLLTWIIYLRYRLSKQMLDNQLEIEKYRIKTQLLAHDPPPHLLTGNGEPEEASAQVLKTRES